MIAEEMQRQRAFLNLVVPVEFQGTGVMPHAMIFDEQEPPELEKRIALWAAESAARRRDPGGAEAEMVRSEIAALSRDRALLQGESTVADRNLILQSLEGVRGNAGPLGGTANAVRE